MEASISLAGTLLIAGKTINAVRDEFKKRISEYVANSEINISVKSVEGNIVYIIGQVKKPGQFVMYQQMNMMQMLSLAGGLTTFSKANDIIILSGSEKG